MGGRSKTTLEPLTRRQMVFGQTRPTQELINNMAGLAAANQIRTLGTEWKSVRAKKVEELSHKDVRVIQVQDEDGEIDAYVAYGRYPDFLQSGSDVVIIQEVRTFWSVVALAGLFTFVCLNTNICFH